MVFSPPSALGSVFLMYRRGSPWVTRASLATARESTVPVRVAFASTALSWTIWPLTSTVLVMSPTVAVVVLVETSSPEEMSARSCPCWLGKKAIFVSARAMTTAMRTLSVGRAYFFIRVSGCARVRGRLERGATGRRCAWQGVVRSL